MHLWYHSQSCFVLSLCFVAWDLWTEGLNLIFFSILHKNYILAPFWPFLTLYCVAPKQYQLVILSFCFVLFFFCFKTHLVRPGKILVIRIRAGTAGYARVPSDLFAIAQTDLRESDATLIAPNLRVWKNGTVPQGDMWGPVMSTMSWNIFRWGRWSWKLHRLIEMSPPLQSEDSESKTHCLNHMVVTEVPLWNFSLAVFFEFHLHVLHKQQRQEKKAVFA